jgi:heme exporter protein D
MPKIDLTAVAMTAEERQIAERILNKGALRASKPAIAYTTYVNERGLKLRQPDDIGGKAAYVWRMVAFTLSPVAKHHCMPCTADFDLPERDYQLRRQMAKQLDTLVDRIIASVPKSQQHGTMRWARALGYA